MIKNSSWKTWMAKITFFVFLFLFYPPSTHHIKLSRFTNHTVQKFFKVQILWIGISWYIHFIFWMTEMIKKHVFFVQSGSVSMARTITRPQPTHALFTPDNTPPPTSMLLRSRELMRSADTDLSSSHNKNAFIHANVALAVLPPSWTDGALHHRDQTLPRKEKKGSQLISNLIKSQRDACVGFL